MQGAAAKHTADARYVSLYAVKPTDFVGVSPKAVVQEGDSVEVGSPLFYDKGNPKVQFRSPVKGIVKSIVRGEKRALKAIVVERTSRDAWHCDTESLSTREGLVGAMLESGIWVHIKQRPFGIVADPDSTPRDIFVSGTNSAPLSADCDYILQGREEELSKGLEMLTLLTGGCVHFTTKHGSRLEQALRSTHQRVVLHSIEGPHPAGNVGTQIAAISPINKGDIVWTVDPQSVANLGLMALKSEYRAERLIAVSGPAATHPQYCRIVEGAQVAPIVNGQVSNPDYPKLEGSDANVRIISGNVLCGMAIDKDSFVGLNDSEVCLLPEGNYYDFMGWLMPGLRKYSFSRTFAYGCLPRCAHKYLPLLPNCLQPKFDTGLHGGERPLVFNGNFERVFPFDIYPLQLLKAAIIGDIELMENLGIYEVEPEDFALCEFIDPSKTEIQTIIRKALELCRKEAV